MLAGLESDMYRFLVSLVHVHVYGYFFFECYVYGYFPKENLKNIEKIVILK